MIFCMTITIGFYHTGLRITSGFCKLKSDVGNVLALFGIIWFSLIIRI